MNNKNLDLFPRFVQTLTASHLSSREIQQMALFGLAGETGELIDIFKKHYYYSKPLDPQHIIEELGDVFHYFQMLLLSLNLSLEDVVKGNMDKLEKRYPSGVFTQEAALVRADKNNGPPPEDSL